MRHIFKATLQQWGMTSEGSGKCELLCIVNATYEGRRGHNPTCRSVYSQSALHFSCTVAKASNTQPPAKQLYYHPETGLTTICGCSRNGLHYLSRWSESVGTGPRGVRRIQLPSITDKYSPVERLFPFEQWHKNKSLISTQFWAKQGSAATFMFIEPQ